MKIVVETLIFTIGCIPYVRLDILPANYALVKALDHLKKIYTELFPSCLHPIFVQNVFRAMNLFQKSPTEVTIVESASYVHSLASLYRFRPTIHSSRF